VLLRLDNFRLNNSGNLRLQVIQVLIQILLPIYGYSSRCSTNIIIGYPKMFLLIRIPLFYNVFEYYNKMIIILRLFVLLISFLFLATSLNYNKMVLPRTNMSTTDSLILLLIQLFPQGFPLLADLSTDSLLVLLQASVLL